MIKLACRRSQQQRLQIAQEYRKRYNVDLVKKFGYRNFLNLEVRHFEEFRTLMSRLFLRQVDLDIMTIHQLHPSAYTDGSPLLHDILQILMTRTNQEIEELSKEHDISYGGNNSLVAFLDDLDVRGILSELVKVKRDESWLTNRTKAVEDAERLHRANELLYTERYSKSIAITEQEKSCDGNFHQK
ncbi:unnamed protein product [Caenorhabditis angaria]|uniref:Uncharacterized protein n=1 Tax=Caenorhabditis angaria TaxID=860376 RepID=A0A9P1N3Y8_9PELO|nr:unnamed protein product [Caenorhabditis angaria]